VSADRNFQRSKADMAEAEARFDAIVAGGNDVKKLAREAIQRQDWKALGYTTQKEWAKAIEAQTDGLLSAKTIQNWFGPAAHEPHRPKSPRGDRSAAAHKAWDTIRAKRAEAEAAREQPAPPDLQLVPSSAEEGEEGDGEDEIDIRHIHDDLRQRPVPHEIVEAIRKGIEKEVSLLLEFASIDAADQQLLVADLEHLVAVVSKIPVAQ